MKTDKAQIQNINEMYQSVQQIDTGFGLKGNHLALKP